MKKTTRFITLLLVLALLAAMFAGCGSSSSSDTEETSSETTQEETDEAESETAETEESEEDAALEAEASSKLPENYPLISEEGVTISAFQSTNPNMTDLITDYNDLVWWQELTERTGISFEWVMAAYSNAEERFNLLITAGDLPAYVCTGNYYTDGITSAVENEIFVDLAEYLPEYAPDYYALTQEDSARKLAYDENGSIVFFYEISEEEFIPNNGVFIRGDLLEEQGLDVPVTYDEYEETLLALKNAYDLSAPIFHYTDNDEWLSAGKGVDLGFSLDADGNLIYGPMQDGYREYLQILNQWYEEGLIYQDFYVIPDGENISYMVKYMSSGDSVVTFGYCEFAGMISLEDDGYFVAGYLPRDNADDQVHLTEGVDPAFNTNRCYAISTNATEEEIQALCLMMNYFYTEEGALFANYGVEGETFTYQEDGTPWYTELITNNPDGLTQTQALLMYIGYMVPCASDYSKYNISSLTTWADFVDAWSTADNEYALPSLSLTTEETEQYTAKSTDVETYLDEVLIKFIIGDMDIDDDDVWQEYLDSLEALGIQDMYDAYEAALERYNNA